MDSPKNVPACLDFSAAIRYNMQDVESYSSGRRGVTRNLVGHEILPPGFKSLTLRHEKAPIRVLFQRNKSLTGFVKFASQVKYACGVWNALRRVRGFLTFHVPRRRKISQWSRSLLYNSLELSIVTVLNAKPAPCAKCERGFWIIVQESPSNLGKKPI